MIEKGIYPKTKRIECKGTKIQITEKLDGSNLVIFKLNSKLYIAQRNYIFSIDEVTKKNDKLYNGLYKWLMDNKDVLTNELNENSAICGEWLGMGQIKYSIGEFDKRFYMFAKANIYDDFELKNIIYNHELFIYPFISQTIPNFIGIVPVVVEISNIPNKEQLDKIYTSYIARVKRNVEGFIINNDNVISKYVRMKNGKLREHFNW